MSDCDHNWRLAERGYVRTWLTEFDDEAKTVIAYYCGSEDWSDDGDGEMRLVCSTCLAEKPVPDDWEIDYQ